jgi:hypothetical protein
MPGNLINLTRERAMSSSGALAGVEFRVLGIRHNDLTGIGTCVAIEKIALP